MMLPIALTLSLLGAAAAPAPDGSAEKPPEAQSAPETPRPQDPFARRPSCESIFLNSEWQLNAKQKVCDLFQNRIFSSTAFAGALIASSASPLLHRWFDFEEAQGGFWERTGINFAQNGFKSTGTYLGGLIFREDPRESPPFLAMRAPTPVHGFWRRTGHALWSNLSAYHCADMCERPTDIKWSPALSRIAGSFASGFSIELLSSDRSNLQQRAWRGTAAAYGATFANSLFTEFKPELSATGGKILTFLGIK